MNKPAEFISKLYQILSSQNYQTIITWHDDEFIIKDTQELTKKILPKYFRHSKLSSFVRQLNLYGFRKIKKSNKKQYLFFKHDMFKKGCVQTLPQITLKQKNKSQQIQSKPQNIKEITQKRNQQLQNLRLNFKSVIQTIYLQLKGAVSHRDNKTKQSLFLLKMCGARDQQAQFPQISQYSFPHLISQPSVTNFLTKPNFDLL